MLLRVLKNTLDNMEGPSLFLAQEQLQPFKGKKVVTVDGNTKIGKERLEKQTVRDIFSWGKHLVIQFDSFALRTHFMLFGTFSATVEGASVTGDYKKARVPRLLLSFKNGNIEMYNCSLKFLEEADAKKTYDFSIDIMSPKWDSEKGLLHVQEQTQEEIADVLLDQEIFAGVGNIIKNEVLSLTFTHPKQKVAELDAEKLKEIIKTTRAFSLQFYRWRKKFLLLKNLKIHRKGACPHCGGKVTHEKTGKRQRISHYCPVCQALR
jgi:endonuclease VIII